LDRDVERALRAAMRDGGVSFKQALNDALRAGLTKPRRQRRRFVQKTYSLGSQENFRWEKALAAADAIEDEELIRKLALRK
jgi:hypothetical protein